MNELFDKYTQVVSDVISLLISEVDGNVKVLSEYPAQLFVFKNANRNDSAVARIDNTILMLNEVRDWHKVLKDFIPKMKCSVTEKSDAEGFVVASVARASIGETSMIYALFNFKLQEGICFGHSLDSNVFVVGHADVSELGDNFELLCTAEH